jgi:hypothetical protein
VHHGKEISSCVFYRVGNVCPAPPVCYKTEKPDDFTTESHHWKKTAAPENTPRRNSIEVKWVKTASGAEKTGFQLRGSGLRWQRNVNAVHPQGLT